MMYNGQKGGADMSKVTVEKFNHDHWGECVKVSNGEIEFVMTVEVGPRIIRLAKVDGVNELFEDLKTEAYTEREGYKDFWGSERWENMGGHRFWHSPESMPRTYIPHDLPIDYEILENGVTVSVDAKQIGIRNIMTATMNAEGEITVKHIAENIGQWPMEFAPWCISVFEHGGLEVIPVAKRDAGYLPNRTVMLWSYSDAKDSRFEMDNKYICMTTSPDGNAENSNAFKMGINCENGFAMYFNHNNLFVKKFGYIDGAKYPDNGCNFESYTNFKIMEIESLGALSNLNPGEKTEYTEVWNLFCDVAKPNSNDEIDKIIEKYVK